MDLVVKMRVKPGDTHVSKALIKMYNEDMTEMDGQLLLEGETAETGLQIPPGGFCTISEVKRPVIYDQEQKAAVPVDFTPGDPLQSPLRPNNTLPGQQQAHPDDIAKFREREEAAVKESKDNEEKRKRDLEAREKQLNPASQPGGVMGARPSHEQADNKALTPPPVRQAPPSRK